MTGYYTRYTHRGRVYGTDKNTKGKEYWCFLRKKGKKWFCPDGRDYDDWSGIGLYWRLDIESICKR